MARVGAAVFFPFWMIENIGICLGLYFKKLVYADWSSFYGDQLIALGIVLTAYVGGKVSEVVDRRMNG